MLDAVKATALRRRLVVGAVYSVVGELGSSPNVIGQ
jgi:hypothetical protein